GAALLLEQRVERFSCVVGRLRLASFVCGEVLDHLRLEERALVARMFVGHSRRDVLAAFPGRRRIEEAAVAAGVKIRAALHADFFECRLIEANALLAALVALEHFRAEAARRPPARRAFDALPLRLGTGALRARSAVRRVRTVSASVLISTMFVLAIAHIHLTKT